MAKIADKVGDALAETYWIALKIILVPYLRIPELDDEGDEEPSDIWMGRTVWDDWETQAQKDLDRLPPLITGQGDTDKSEPGNTETLTAHNATDASPDSQVLAFASRNESSIASFNRTVSRYISPPLVFCPINRDCVSFLSLFVAMFRHSIANDPEICLVHRRDCQRYQFPFRHY